MHTYDILIQHQQVQCNLNLPLSSCFNVKCELECHTNYLVCLSFKFSEERDELTGTRVFSRTSLFKSTVLFDNT